MLRRHITKKKIKKLLLIRLKKLGDTILGTLVADAIKDFSPEIEIHYLVEENYAELFYDHPSIDRVVKIKKGLNFKETLIFSLWLKKEDYDLAIDLHSGIRSSFMAFLCCRERYGLKTSTSFLFTKTKPRRISSVSHHIENQFQLLNFLEIETTPKEYRFPPPAHIDFGIQKKYVLLHPFSSPLKSLSEEQAIGIAEGIENLGFIPVFVGSDEEKEGIERLRKGINMAGISLREMRSLAAEAEIFIGVDSGLSHLASTTKVPIIAIFGPHLSQWYKPWRRKNIVIIEKDLPCRPCSEKKCQFQVPICIRSIKPEEIINKVKELLRIF